MKLRHLLSFAANFFAVLLLVSLIAAPFYFAKNLTKVESIAGAKTIAPDEITFQTENFPNLTFSQNGDKYKVSFTKISPTQAFIGILTVTNPQDQPKTYSLEVTSGQAKLFFGADLENQITQISLSPQSSAAVSLFSPNEASAESQTVEFKLGLK